MKKSMKNSEVLSQIRQATGPIHKDLEELPFSRAIVEETISLSDYLQYLGQHFWVHQGLENEVEGSKDLLELHPVESFRAPLLARDYYTLGGISLPSASGPARAMREYFSALRSDGSLGLAGAIYVFEGSKMGSAVLVRHLSRALDLPLQKGVGLDYHYSDFSNLRRQWGAFCHQLTALAEAKGASQAIVDGAVNTFLLLHDLYASLPLGKKAEKPHLATG